MRELLLTIFDRTVGWIQFIDFWLWRFGWIIVDGYNELWITVLGTPRAALLGQGIGVLLLVISLLYALSWTYLNLAFFFGGEPFPSKVAAGARMPSVWGNAWRYLFRFIVAAIILRLNYFLLTFLLRTTLQSLSQ